MADSHVIYKAEVQVGIKDKGFKAEAKKISDRVKSLGRDLNIKPGTAEPTKEMKALQAETRKAQQELDRLLKKQESLRKAHQNSPEYKALAKDIQKAEQELDGMITKQSLWAEMGLVGNSQFNALDDQIEQARIQLEGLYEKQRAIAESGATDKEAQEWYEVGDSVDRARRRVQELNAEQEKMKTSGSAYERAKRAATGVSSAAKKAKKEAGGAAKAFRNFGSSVGGASSKLLKFILHGKGAAGALTSMKKGLLTGAGLKPLAKLAALGGGVWLAVRGISDGMKNLVQYSGETNNSVSMLWGSLIQLKNALATAFAPIFNAAAPALNALIQLVTKAATAIAHFTAAFTGKSTVVVAKKVTTDYAAGMADAADATGSANKAAKEYQKTLLGFDQMNILNKEEKSSGAGSGGGVSGGGLDPADMFETVDVSNGAKSLVDKIKDAWKDADFTGLGKEWGDKLAAQLNKIPWEDLQNTAYKIGKSIATGFNGLNDSEFWTSLGATLGQSVNTVLAGVQGFVQNFDWTLAGQSLATGVNQFFNTVKWDEIGQTISASVGGIFDLIKGFADETEWRKIGTDLASVITNIDFPSLIVKALETGTSIVDGFTEFLEGALEEAFDGLETWLEGDPIGDIKSILSADVNLNIHEILGAKNIVDMLTDKTIDIAMTLTPTIAKGVGGFISRYLNGTLTDEDKTFIVEFNTAADVGTQLLTKGPIQLTAEYIVDKVVDKIPGKDKVIDKVKAIFGEAGTDESLFTDFENKTKRKFTASLGSTSDEIKSKTLGGFIANLSDKKKDKLFNNLVDLTANLTGKQKDPKKFGESALNMIANFTGKKKDEKKFGESALNMIANFTGKKNSLSSKLLEMTAKITSKKNDLSDSEKILGFKASITSRVNNLSDSEKVLGGFTAKLIDKIDAIKSHTIGGFTAEISDFKASRNSVGKVVALTKAEGGLYRNGRWQPVTMAAGGGQFTTGQMFVAREAGPELVGRIGSGTAVMNNDQIVASVSKGVYDAMLSAMATAGDDRTVNIYLQGDAGKLFKVVQGQANDYMNATGMAPFPV